MATLERIRAVSGEQFSISDTEEELRRKFSLPLPTISPRERLRRLTAFHNFTYLHRGECAATGESMLQIYPPNSRFPVYSVPYWWSDDWDPLELSVEYDSSQPFFP